MNATSPYPYEHIRIEHRGPITWLILNRPESANALSNELLDEFSDALKRLVSEGGPVIGIRGEGRGFSAGYDIGQVGKANTYGSLVPDPIADRERLRRNVDRYVAMWDHPKPIIAAVHGYCIAGATQMCVYADITVVTDDAKIGEPTIPMGGGYVAPLWVPLVGAKRAKEMAFVPGNSIDGKTAVEWGWANHSVAADQLIECVESLAERIALTPPEVLRIKKLSINRSAEAMGFRSAGAAVAEMDALLHMAPSVLEIKRTLAEIGLKESMKLYRSERTTPLTPAKKKQE